MPYPYKTLLQWVLELAIIAWSNTVPFWGIADNYNDNFQGLISITTPYFLHPYQTSQLTKDLCPTA